jgi:HEPN family protein
VQFEKQFERDFMRRTLKLVQDYQGPYDATLLLNCLLGLLIVTKETSLNSIGR